MLHFANTLTLLLAQTQGDGDKQKALTTVSPSDVSREVNKGIQHDMPWELLMVGIGATLTAIVVISLRRRWIRRHENPGPLTLFSAIARKAGLSWQDRYILWRIARANDLPTPIALLLARGALQHYAQQYTRHRSITARARLDARLARIEADLFGH